MLTSDVWRIQKGFPDESEGLQRELEKFFEKWGKVNAVRMRRDEHKKFKVRLSPQLPSFLSRQYRTDPSSVVFTLQSHRTPSSSNSQTSPP